VCTSFESASVAACALVGENTASHGVDLVLIKYCVSTPSVEAAMVVAGVLLVVVLLLGVGVGAFRLGGVFAWEESMTGCNTGDCAPGDRGVGLKRDSEELLSM